MEEERDGADDKPVYDLFATSNHIGERESSGHYVPNCLADADGTWHYFNDQHVSPTTQDELQGNGTYVLFYKRRGT